MIKLCYELKNFILSLFSRKTIGVRALVVQEGQILLVKHTYTPGWHHPGGGIEGGETGLQAVKRELKEEVGINLLENPQILGFYYNILNRRDDYIIVYVCTSFKRKNVKSREILEAKWFPLESLPPDITLGTKNRIAEYLGESSLSDKW
ncbi:MAG: NUDIX domain-containing protein [Alphaproteobacteria bacterium]|nr:NUDIX domain-containing protein [Alphaproteobacteria bacterium]